MAKHTADYAITFGLSGCYMPNTEPSAIRCHTRSELAAAIKSELDVYELPASLFREVRISRLWGFIKRHGSSTAHFHLDHQGYTLAFHGLTEAEYEEATQDD